MDMPNEMPAPAPAEIHKEVETWECVICYEGGKKTGQLTIACGHTMCLGCYTLEAKRVAGLGQELKCPYCRQTIRLTEGPTKEEQDKIKNHIRVIQLDNHRIQELQKQMDDINKQIADRKVKVLKLAEDTGADIAQVQAEVLLVHIPAAQPVRVNMAQAQALEAAFNAAQAPIAQPARIQQPVPAMPPPHVPMPQPENGVRCPGCRTHRPAEDIRYRHIPMEDRTHRLKRCERCLLVARREQVIWRNAH